MHSRRIMERRSWVGPFLGYSWAIWGSSHSSISASCCSQCCLGLPSLVWWQDEAIHRLLHTALRLQHCWPCLPYRNGEVPSTPPIHHSIASEPEPFSSCWSLKTLAAENQAWLKKVSSEPWLCFGPGSLTFSLTAPQIPSSLEGNAGILKGQIVFTFLQQFQHPSHCHDN